ncbi:excisionase family DNA binding protein [Dyadobacter sp. BE34]|uniref:Excisionase family DNA binding protein n=1 Tax=Dyadobacter fermentans TaxID=94254 RepID=A0ABU1QX22_9BACT|nr:MULTISPECIES: helix-turn-helix domain-containing protein [Dyadobacter]MDR6805547.1 excisionase family DNA binding protein [Dyadobacter fermentans]MDR7042693.1 excisionase family DNA binding protein [Dyadobacter sp. BE242]MDR7197005.1 excisionase family DNA binding protein [Dyadobacter sp. BE34]MDR7215560.1 excisionase family DNA binding protein [Dyadobacter sp. BE31]MDR7263096.1 excisionase family DNA binding protein [Dyadobacter sp. BE32]
MSNILDEILLRLESVEEKLVKAIDIRYNEVGLDKFQFVSTQEAASILSVSVQTLYKYATTKRIRHYKSGNRLYFKIEDLNNFIERQRIDVKPRYR